MKKILLISTFQIGAYGHVVDYVLKKMGYHVYKFDHRELIFLYGNEFANNHLETISKGLEPDYVLAIKGRGLDPKVIKDIPCKKINWWFDNATRYSDFNDYMNVYDKFYVVEEGQGYPWMPIGIDTDLHKPIFDKNPAFQCDVIFAGTAHPKRSKRVSQILRNLPVKVKIWGNGWEGNPLWAGPAIYWGDLMKAYSMAKIILNNHYYPSITPNMRAMEAPATGTAVLSDTGPGLESCFEREKEYIPYNSVKEARYLIMKYLKEPEELNKIGNAGFDKVRTEHLLRHKLWEILE